MLLESGQCQVELHWLCRFIKHCFGYRCHHSTRVFTLDLKLHFVTGFDSCGNHFMAVVLWVYPQCYVKMPRVPVGSERLGTPIADIHSETPNVVAFSREQTATEYSAVPGCCNIS